MLRKILIRHSLLRGVRGDRNSMQPHKKLVLVVWKLLKWGYYRHRNKGKKWIRRKYFKTVESDNWVFATGEGNNPLKLIQHRSTEIKRYVKVKGMASPDDGDWIYWSSRMGVHPRNTRKSV